jgi:hypothetical protein
MAKVNNLPASAYAKPHTMSGGPVTETRVNRSSSNTVDMSIGYVKKDPEGPTTKTSGTVTRGNGAATKGITARGPMA